MVHRFEGQCHYDGDRDRRDVLQTAGGVDYPTVPPGPVILAAAAGAHLGYELQNEPLPAERGGEGSKPFMTGVTVDGTPAWRLRPRTRNRVLVVHILSAGAWIGIDIVMAVLVFAAR